MRTKKKIKEILRNWRVKVSVKIGGRVLEQKTHFQEFVRLILTIANICNLFVSENLVRPIKLQKSFHKQVSSR